MKGSIRKRGSTYTAYWFTTDPATGKRRQHSRGGFKLKEPARPARGDSAREFLNGIVGEVQAGAWRPDAKMTVGRLLDEWHAAKSGSLAPNTAAMYRTVIDGWIAPHIGGLPVDQLTPRRAQEVVEVLRAGGSRLNRGSLSPRSVQLAVQVLKAATRWASRTELLSRDPLLGFDRPSAKASQAATGAWSADEARAFLRSIDGDRLEAAWWLLLGRGLRRGELCGLRWSHVDLDAGRIGIVETRVVVQSKAVRSQPKTDAGRRLVPLDDHLAAVLRRHRTRQTQERWAAREAWSDTDHVFTDELGQPYRPEHVSRTFTRLAKTAGLRRIRLHDTRHTAATLLMAAGVPTKVVAEILGHSSPVITQSIYQHVLPGMGEAAGEQLTRILEGG